MDNLMEGIKGNQVVAKILAAKITNETNELQDYIEVFVLKLDTLKVLSVLEQTLVSFPFPLEE
jgi:hypothetical protein